KACKRPEIHMSVLSISMKHPRTEYNILYSDDAVNEAEEQLSYPSRCRRLETSRYGRVERLARALLGITHHHQADVAAMPAPQGLSARMRGPAHLARVLDDARPQ